MEPISSNFWKEWLRSDTVRRLELVNSLTLPPSETEERYSIVSLLNSYLSDLEEYLKTSKGEE